MMRHHLLCVCAGAVAFSLSRSEVVVEALRMKMIPIGGDSVEEAASRTDAMVALTFMSDLARAQAREEPQPQPESPGAGVHVQPRVEKSALPGILLTRGKLSAKRLSRER